MMIQMKKITVNGYEETTGKVTVDTEVKAIFLKQKKRLDLLTEKGVYPYDYTNALERFNEEQLPSKEQFYRDITNDDCNKAKQIRKHFNIKNMGVYHDLYLQTDVLLLMDVLENF